MQTSSGILLVAKCVVSVMLLLVTSAGQEYFILRSLLRVNCKYYELLSPCHKLLCNKHATCLQYVSIHELAAGCEGPSLTAAWMLTDCAAHSCILLCMHQELWYLPQTPIAYLQAMSSSPSADLGMRLPKLGDA